MWHDQRLNKQQKKRLEKQSYHKSLMSVPCLLSILFTPFLPWQDPCAPTGLNSTGESLSHHYISVALHVSMQLLREWKKSLEVHLLEVHKLILTFGPPDLFPVTADYLCIYLLQNMKPNLYCHWPNPVKCSFNRY